MLKNLIKIYCTNCDETFSVVRHSPIIREYESEDVGVGYSDKSGRGEEGVFFCPFCGESERYAPLKELDK
jgi:hypothetical protein